MGRGGQKFEWYGTTVSGAFPNSVVDRELFDPEDSDVPTGATLYRSLLELSVFAEDSYPENVSSGVLATPLTAIYYLTQEFGGSVQTISETNDGDQIFEYDDLLLCWDCDIGVSAVDNTNGIAHGRRYFMQKDTKSRRVIENRDILMFTIESQDANASVFFSLQWRGLFRVD